MDDLKIKNDMMCLWKRVFADADNYIKLVFDSYFKDKLKFTIYNDNRLLSAMLCVDYNFISENNHLKSVYQCGLATLPEYRNKGLMTNLISKANYELFKNNYILSFLIPSNDLLRVYYNKNGYVDTAFIECYNYNFIHQFIKDVDFDCSANLVKYNNIMYKIISVSDVFDESDVDGLSIGYIKNNKKLLNTMSMLYDDFNFLLSYMDGLILDYTFNDFLAICIENFISGGKILFLLNDNNKPLSFIICSNIREGDAMVQLHVSVSEEKELILLQLLKSFLPKHTSLAVHKYPMRYKQNKTDALYSPYYIGYSDVGQTPKIETYVLDSTEEKRQTSFAMVKILNVLEILKFAARLYPDAKFSILINSDIFHENEGFYSVEHGQVEFLPKSKMTPIELYNIKKKSTSCLDWFDVTVPELASILFRRSKCGSIVESVLPIPRLSLHVALMLE